MVLGKDQRAKYEISFIANTPLCLLPYRTYKRRGLRKLKGNYLYKLMHFTNSTNNASATKLCYMWRLQLSFTSRSLSTQKLSMDKNERNRFFNSCQEIRILLEFSWPSLLNILESVVCLSQTTTKFVLLTILNHIMFIPYFVNDLTFLFSSGIATFFFFSTDKHFSIVFYSN